MNPDSSNSPASILTEAVSSPSGAIIRPKRVRMPTRAFCLRRALHWVLRAINPRRHIIEPSA